MEDSKIEIQENKMEQYFIDKLNNSLDHIRKESWNTNPNFIDNNEFLYSNSPVLSVYNSDEENDCFDDIHEFQSKTSFQKLTFQDVKRSLDKYYECEDKYINELLKTGYTIIKVNDVNEGTSVYHLTNGKEIIICYTGSAWANTRCLKE